MNYVLFDGKVRQQLLPLTFTRPLADMRVGIFTIREKWERYIGHSFSSLTVSYLQELFPLRLQKDNVFINGSVLPNPQLVQQIKHLQPMQAIADGDVLIALRGESKYPGLLHTASGEVRLITADFKQLPPVCPYQKINHLWDIFLLNGMAIQHDFDLLTRHRTSQPINDTNRVVNPQAVFIEPGATVQGAFLNASQGPIYIGAHAEVMEGSTIRGPFALCEHATVKMGTRIYGGTTVGPYSKVGGEVSNSVIFGYSNKAHDGYLGNSILGEWCNLGAGTNNSNLKNNYSRVSIWNYAEGKMTDTGQQFCGLIMGDHSKCSINTMFNTGTVVGVGANIFGADFPPKFIPSFSWGGAAGFVTYQFNQFLQTAAAVYHRRGKTLSDAGIALLKTLFDKGRNNEL
ncbi:glucose-1-phosphate thymidylyltransferase [Sphingobacteriales bacterium UPWRP_1]|nr:glucose-1-phosphate thymidylyltransferase [Sphingobacteriales bacterium TSM_CSM]PSJ76581.1 glucose-1-phosphate thymidylyltransferase [Sphingobacteriales bacterium UPWRP_1]